MVGLGRVFFAGALNLWLPWRKRTGCPNTSRQAVAVDHMLPPPRSEAPAQTLDRELANIASRFGRPTADIVALVIEYPWVAEAAPMTR